MEIDVRALDVTLLISIGVVLGAIVVGMFSGQRRWQRRMASLDIKVLRYRAILQLMWALLESRTHAKFTLNDRPDLDTREKLFLELESEWHNMILFASNDVLKKTHRYLMDPSSENLKASIIAMREDLGGDKLSSMIKKLDF